MTRWLGPVGRGQWPVRALVATMPLLALLCTLGAGQAPAVWLAGLVLLLGVGWACFPESAVGATVLVVVVAWWGIGLREGLHPWALPAALALLTAHVAATLAAYGPLAMPVDPALTRLWVRRGLLVWLATPVTYALAVGVGGSVPPAPVWLVGLAAVAAAATAASVLLGRPD
ncbi:hypothetical protein NOK12_33020 [Nocardioides sp. OK12]|uniref:hypothetical protein n=1 Tax=Nocardioides TaxID=1839 RepID=UPI0021C25EEA|nr:hypothetical protein [Nocardioides sp. OK12]GHJ60784.1 hypothetical protein NOK12_33020 [Nocardioides sp. OK12]